DAHPHGQCADLQTTETMHAARVNDGKALPRFLENLGAFLDAQRLEGFVFQRGDGQTFVVIAHAAFETSDAAGRGIGQRGVQLADIHGNGAEGKVTHPPDTGGMNTTESPSCSGVCHSLNSELMATLSCSRAKRKEYFWRSSS